MNCRYLLLCDVMLVLVLTACGTHGREAPSHGAMAAHETPFVSAAPTEAAEPVDIQSGSAEETNRMPAPMESETPPQEDDGMIDIQITVGDQTFAAKLYENDTARALSARFPMTRSMRELHGNEKYDYLEEGLPVNAARPEGIHTGDLMLYGSDCLVLFYDSFETSYSYTPLGYVEDITGLSEALGAGDVQVSFACN